MAAVHLLPKPCQLSVYTIWSMLEFQLGGGGMQVWSNNRASPPAATLTVVCADPLLMSGLQDCLTLATHKDERLAQGAARLLCKHLLEQLHDELCLVHVLLCCPTFNDLCCKVAMLPGYSLVKGYWGEIAREVCAAGCCLRTTQNSFCQCM